MAKRRTDRIKSAGELAEETHIEDIEKARRLFNGITAQLETAPLILEEIRNAGIELKKAEKTIAEPNSSAEDMLNAGYDEMKIAEQIKQLIDMAKAATGFSEDKV
jgi:hypothetical protein